MPAIDIKFFHQPYFKFKNPEADNFKSFSFEDTWKVSKVIEKIAEQIDETDKPETLKGKEGVKNICLYDSKGRKCLGDIQIHEYLNKDLEINIDYENHVVLEFR